MLRLINSMVTGLIRPVKYYPGISQKLIKLEVSSCRCSQLKCNEESDETTTTISIIMSAQCGPYLRHIERAQSAQFYASTKASIKEFWLCPVFILRQVMKLKVILPYSRGQLSVWTVSKSVTMYSYSKIIILLRWTYVYYPSCQSALNKLTWSMLIGYIKGKQRLHMCTYQKCQLDLCVKYHVNKDILK